MGTPLSLSERESSSAIVVHSLYLGHPDNIVSPCGHVVTNAEAGEIARLFKAWEKYWDWYYRVGHPQ